MKRGGNTFTFTISFTIITKRMRICLPQDDKKRTRKHFRLLGLSGAVLAIAAKASVKAEAPIFEDEVNEAEYDFEEEAEVKVKKSGKPKKSCVICVGSTGTGKSTLIKIMTGAEVETSSRADSVTKTSSVYTKKRGLQDKNPPQYWIDTQGWEDSDIDKQDNQIFKDIFQCLWDSEMTEISGIVWNINPNERATDTLQRQARLIPVIIDRRFFTIQIII